MAAPLHERISADLRSRIQTGQLPVGTALPSEAELGERWQGSRAPVRQALATLRAEGLISGGRGKPAVVARAQVAQPFDSFASFSRWVQGMGRTPGQRTVEVARRPSTPEIAGSLEIEAGEPVVQLLRLRLLDDEPVMLERTSFALPVGASLLAADLDAGSIYEHLTGNGLEVGDAHHVIDAVPADTTDAALLEIEPGAPLLRERRIARDACGAVFEVSDDRYRPDMVTFTIDNAPEGRPLFGRTWRADEEKQA